jgi:hypothetical protein
MRCADPRELKREQFTATAHREGDWWVIEIPGLGQTTQARTAADIDVMARELIAIMRNVDPSEVQVTMTKLDR